MGVKKDRETRRYEETKRRRAEGFGSGARQCDYGFVILKPVCGLKDLMFSGSERGRNMRYFRPLSPALSPQAVGKGWTLDGMAGSTWIIYDMMF